MPNLKPKQRQAAVGRDSSGTMGHADGRPRRDLEGERARLASPGLQWGKGSRSRLRRVEAMKGDHEGNARDHILIFELRWFYLSNLDLNVAKPTFPQ